MMMMIDDDGGDDVDALWFCLKNINQPTNLLFEFANILSLVKSTRINWSHI